MPSATFTGPSDEVLKENVAQYVAANNRPASTSYKHARTDLNGDGLLDAIVYFHLPHQIWCGWDGCSMAIFQAQRTSFTPIASMSGIRGPIFVLNKSTNGWRDIIVRISGTKGIRDRNVLFAFDGRSYPRHPMTAPNFQGSLRGLQKEEFFR